MFIGSTEQSSEDGMKTIRERNGDAKIGKRVRVCSDWLLFLISRPLLLCFNENSRPNQYNSGFMIS